MLSQHSSSLGLVPSMSIAVTTWLVCLHRSSLGLVASTSFVWITSLICLHSYSLGFGPSMSIAWIMSLLCLHNSNMVFCPIYASKWFGYKCQTPWQVGEVQWLEAKNQGSPLGGRIRNNASHFPYPVPCRRRDAKQKPIFTPACYPTIQTGKYKRSIVLPCRWWEHRDLPSSWT